MAASIGDIRGDVDAIHNAETAVGGVLDRLSYSAEYGYGSTAEAINDIRTSRRHADLALAAAAIGNAIMAAKHEAQAIDADSDAARMLKRAEGHGDDLLDGLQAAAALVDGALGNAKSVVALDDSSPAAAIHGKIAAQSEALQGYAQRVEEIRTRLRGSRDPTELQVAADHFVALRHDLDEGMGRAQEIASDSLDYNSRL
jgi:hypothetical protein